MPEVDDEYQALCDEKASKEAEKSSVESDISSLDSKIEALRAAYTKIDDAKESIKDVRKYLRKLPNDYDDSWKGQFADDVYKECKKGGVRIDYYYTRYIELVDDIQDNLNLKITELENEKLRKIAVLGEILSWLNNFATWVQNLAN